MTITKIDAKVRRVDCSKAGGCVAHDERELDEQEYFFYNC